jgi:predicted transglutaminase-like cysteine proteinase
MMGQKLRKNLPASPSFYPKRIGWVTNMKQFCSSSSLIVGLLLFTATGSFAAHKGGGDRDPVLGIEMARFSDTIVPEWRSFTVRRRTGSHAWSAFVSRLRLDLGHENPVEKVNHAVNGVRYVSDAANWRGAKYWETPSEFLKRGGDCKDYALAKYSALRALGVPAGSMRILVLPDHAVLVVNSTNGPTVLDNQRESTYPLDQGLLSRAVYAVSDAGAWIKLRTNP